MTTICPIYSIIENKSENAYVLKFWMTILVPGWSRDDLFLRNRYKINYFLYFLNLWRLTRWQMIKNLALITFTWTKIEKCLTSWILQKLVPGLKGSRWSRISIETVSYDPIHPDGHIQRKWITSSERRCRTSNNVVQVKMLQGRT